MKMCIGHVKIILIEISNRRSNSYYWNEDNVQRNTQKFCLILISYYTKGNKRQKILLVLNYDLALLQFSIVAIWNFTHSRRIIGNKEYLCNVITFVEYPTWVNTFNLIPNGMQATNLFKNTYSVMSKRKRKV